MNFKNKICIISGAGNGIGAVVAEQMAKKDAIIVACDINYSSLKALEEKLSIYAITFFKYKMDVRNEEEVFSMVEDVICKLGRIDILINNAGVYENNRMPFNEMDKGGWETTIGINLYGTMNCTRAVINNMIENKSGRIVNIASVAGVYGIRTMVDYSASKGAIIAFTTALAKEIASYNITVNAVSPGNIQTRESRPELSFMDRSGSPEECANVICFLASDEASFVSGQNWLVDGCRKVM